MYNIKGTDIPKKLTRKQMQEAVKVSGVNFAKIRFHEDFTMNEGGFGLYCAYRSYDCTALYVGSTGNDKRFSRHHCSHPGGKDAVIYLLPMTLTREDARYFEAINTQRLQKAGFAKANLEVDVSIKGLPLKQYVPYTNQQTPLWKYRDGGELNKVRKIIGSWMRNLRTLAGISQKELSEILKSSPERVSKLENGHGDMKVKELLPIIMSTSSEPWDRLAELNMQLYEETALYDHADNEEDD